MLQTVLETIGYMSRLCIAHTMIGSRQWVVVLVYVSIGKGVRYIKGTDQPVGIDTDIWAI